MESKAWVLYFKGDEQSEDLPLFTYSYIQFNNFFLKSAKTTFFVSRSSPVLVGSLPSPAGPQQRGRLGQV